MPWRMTVQLQASEKKAQASEQPLRRYLPSTYQVPDTVAVTQDTSVKKRTASLLILMGETGDQQKTQFVSKVCRVVESG